MEFHKILKAKILEKISNKKTQEISFSEAKKTFEKRYPHEEVNIEQMDKDLFVFKIKKEIVGLYDKEEGKFYYKDIKVNENLAADQEKIDNEIIDRYLSKKGKIRKKGFVYKIDRTDPNNLKIIEIPSSNFNQINTAVKQTLNKIKGIEK